MWGGSNGRRQLASVVSSRGAAGGRGQPWALAGKPWRCYDCDSWSGPGQPCLLCGKALAASATGMGGKTAAGKGQPGLWQCFDCGCFMPHGRGCAGCGKQLQQGQPAGAVGGGKGANARQPRRPRTGKGHGADKASGGDKESSAQEATDEPEDEKAKAAEKVHGLWQSAVSAWGVDDPLAQQLRKRFDEARGSRDQDKPLAFRLARLDKQSAQATEKVGVWSSRVEKADEELRLAKQKLADAQAGMQAAKQAAAKVQADRRQLLESSAAGDTFGLGEDLWTKLGIHGPLPGGGLAEEALRRFHEAINSLRQLQGASASLASPGGAAPAQQGVAAASGSAAGGRAQPFRPSGPLHFPALGQGDDDEELELVEDEEDEQTRIEAMQAEARAMEEAFRSEPAATTGGYGQAPRQTLSRRSMPWSG